MAAMVGRIGITLALPLAALAPARAPAATANVTVNATVVRPVTLTATGSLNFGTIVINSIASPQTVTLGPANTLTCGGGLICSGATSVPTYNVQGTNKMVVTIIKTPSTLHNAANGATLTLTPLGPNSITLTNSGAPGSNFAIGGSITLSPSTGDGLYSGIVDVTVDYQ